MSNKKVLIITYYWPPSGGVGVQRWMNYALELKNRGFEPIIYTPENPQFELQDASQQIRVAHLRTIRTKIWEPFDFFHRLTGNKNRGKVQQGLVLEKKSKSWKDELVVWLRGNLFIPDPRRFWIRPSIRFLRELIRQEEIKTIVTTGPPHSMHLIGLGLKKQCKVQWLADFRDPWSQWDVLPKLKATGFTLSRHKKLERRVLKSADMITTVSQDLLHSLQSNGGKGKTELLYNGVSVDFQKPKVSSETLTIGYYGMLNELRNPSGLWQVLAEISVAQKINLRLGGIVAESIREEVESISPLNNQTDFLGYLSHQDVQDEYKKCDVLLLLLNKSDNAKWILPVKFFEYLASGRHILALGPLDSELARLAREIPTFKMISFDDAETQKEWLLNFDKASRDFSPAKQTLEQFNHANLADRLEQLLNELND